MKRLAAVLAVAALLTGCQTMTGRSVGQWVDDRTVTAKVKARLAAAGMVHLTRIHVDTYHGTVYLTGGVDSADMKYRAEEIAGGVAQADLIVNNLHVLNDAPAAASPVTEASAALHPIAPQRSPLAAVGITRLEVESGTPSWTRYGGYDAEGRLVATVFAVSVADAGGAGLADLPAQVEIDRLDLYPEPGGLRSFVVLWHSGLDAVGAARFRAR